ncbi:MAG: hypothetical protein WC319_03880 [Candidatus Paceibacterota bacterium]|jgi:hypothetical protein
MDDKIIAISKYLPYGLKMYNKGIHETLKKAGKEYTPSTLRHLTIDGLFWVGKEQDSRKIGEDVYKPLLRPLTDLTEPILKDGEIPLFKILKMIFPKAYNISVRQKFIVFDFTFNDQFLDITNYSDIKLFYDEFINCFMVDFGGIPRPINRQLLFFEKLLEWHFNVFNLPEDLWIDINQLSKYKL